MELANARFIWVNRGNILASTRIIIISQSIILQFIFIEFKVKSYRIRYTTYASPDLIKSCFSHCKPADKKRLEEWLQDDNRKRLTLRFRDGTKVELEKEQVGGKILE